MKYMYTTMMMSLIQLLLFFIEPKVFKPFFNRSLEKPAKTSLPFLLHTFYMNKPFLLFFHFNLPYPAPTA